MTAVVSACAAAALGTVTRMVTPSPGSGRILKVTSVTMPHDPYEPMNSFAKS
jgi:hypothetical protein